MQPEVARRVTRGWRTDTRASSRFSQVHRRGRSSGKPHMRHRIGRGRHPDLQYSDNGSAAREIHAGESVGESGRRGGSEDAPAEHRCRGRCGSMARELDGWGARRTGSPDAGTADETESSRVVTHHELVGRRETRSSGTPSSPDVDGSAGTRGGAPGSGAGEACHTRRQHPGRHEASATSPKVPEVIKVTTSTGVEVSDTSELGAGLH
jgi:hypothetical protein